MRVFKIHLRSGINLSVINKDDGGGGGVCFLNSGKVFFYDLAEDLVYAVDFFSLTYAYLWKG